ncbi:MAG TPA: cyclic nucleotide-binding domain-containing protein [Actinomycetes bacterium]
MDHPSVEDLQKVPLLADRSDAERRGLAELFDIMEYGAGRTLVGEGRAGYAFYAINRGRVAVTHEGEQLRELGPGDFFGEIAILGKRRRTATVTATEPVVVWVLLGSAVEELQSSRPEVAAALQDAMRHRLEAG